MALVTINGKELQIDDGTLILDAARDAGYEIPTFCYQAKLSKLGSCRMCLVEIEGMRKLQPSCITPVMDGMKVHTESPDVVNARKSQLEFMLINHPLDCPVCDQAGECDLQDMTYEFGGTSGRFRWKKRTFPKRDMGPTMVKEMNRCIACRRCSRYSAEISGDYSMTELNRGNDLEMGTFCHTPIDSEFIGNTVQLCPVGALTSSAFRFKARAWDLDKTETICPHCSVGCSITSESKYVSQSVTHLHQTKTLGSTPALDASEVRVFRNNAVEDKGVTEISLCDRGRYGYHFINSDKRLTAPMVREGDKLVETTWGKALSAAADGLKTIKEKNGAKAIGGITSGICTNEDGYAFRKFLKDTIGTGNVDISTGGALDAGARERLAAMRGGVREVKEADTILIIGSSVSTDTPIVSMNAGIAARMNGAKLITITTGENRLLTSKPVNLTYRKGEELALIGALTKAAIDGQHVADAFGMDRKKELDAVTDGVKGIDVAKAAEAAGISKEDAESVVSLLAGSSKGMIIFGDDLISGDKGGDAVKAIYNFASLLGYRGEKGKVVYTPASGNQPGTMDVGVEPDNGGLDYNGMLEASKGGKLKALYIMGDDPVNTASDTGGVKGALEKLDFLIVQDIFMTETAKLADVVLPAVSYAEKSGTVTNLEGRVQKLNRSIKPLGSGREDWRILGEIAEEMGSGLGFGSVAEITCEISKSVHGYSGAGLDKVEGDGVIVSAGEGPSLEKVDININFEKARKDSSLTVVPGRDVLLNGSLTANDEGLLKLSSGPGVYINDEDGVGLGIADGDEITVTTDKGTLKVAAKVTDRIAKGHVVIPVNHPEVDAWAIFGGKSVAVDGTISK